MTTRSRGKHPNDDKLFASKWHPIFTQAVDDLCYLLSRGYADNSAMQLVGNRYKLNKRQRHAVLRVSSSDQEIASRMNTECNSSDLENQVIGIDGFNLLILLESAMSGAFVFKSRDGTYRDISSVHGSYKRIQHTEDAILLMGKTLKEMKVKSVEWYLDQPISNSGRLKTKLMEISAAHDFGWSVDLVYNPDKVLAQSESIVVSADGWVLDHSKRWFNLGGFLIENHLQDSNVLVI